MPAFNTAVNGLRMHQETIDAIANNIANTNTVAYKSGVVHLTDTFYQTLRASSPGQPVGVQMGTGGQVAAISQNMTQGSFQRTGGPTDMAIGGDGFFVLQNTNGTFFTRAGDFALNSNSELVNFEGMNVQGILGDKSSQSGDAVDPGTNPAAVTSIGNIVIPTTFVSQTPAVKATGQITLGDVSPSVGNTLTINGVTLTFVAGGAAATAGLNIGLVDGTGAINYTAALQATQVMNAINNNTVGMTITGSQSTPADSVISLTANTAGSAANAIALTSVPIQSASNQSLLIRTGTMSGGADIGPLREEGVNSFSVGSDGAVNLFGSFGTTRTIAYVLLTKFSDPSALTRVGNNVFSFSTGAGTFSGGTSFSMAADTRKANTNGLGTIQGNALELSNVDLSQQFTDMITTQRAFEANARVITTGDEMLQTVVNLRR